MKRILTMQDLSCIGHCSLGVALPIISAMGIETVVLPTAILSTHTAFNNFYIIDLSDKLKNILAIWKKENIIFDGFYSGYLASTAQIDIAKEIIKENKDKIILVDPCMADFGKLYKGFDDKYINKMVSLCKEAKIICPNYSEVAFLLNEEYREELSEKQLQQACLKLSLLGPEIIIITGSKLNNKYGVYAYDVKKEYFYFYGKDKIDAKVHGAGDIWTSAFFGCMVHNYELRDSLKIATDFVYEAIKLTANDQNRRFYGIDFELAIPDLLNKIQN